MRKVILNVAVSLDGFIEGPNGEYDWCFTDQDYGMNTFLKSIDAVFYGRKSYEMMLCADFSGENPFKGFKTYVFSKSLQEPYPNTLLVSTDVVNQVTKLKQLEGKDIWLFGGASLLDSFLKEGLVDQLSLAVHPILLGEGKRLFEKMSERTKLTLLNSTSYSSGLIMLLYEIDKK